MWNFVVILCLLKCQRLRTKGIIFIAIEKPDITAITGSLMKCEGGGEVAHMSVGFFELLVNWMNMPQFNLIWLVMDLYRRFALLQYLTLFVVKIKKELKQVHPVAFLARRRSLLTAGLDWPTFTGVSLKSPDTSFKHLPWSQLTTPSALTWHWSDWPTLALDGRHW